MDKVYNKARNNNQCNINTRLCNYLDYSGKETQKSKSDVGSFRFTYNIPSNSTTLYEEYLIYDAINAIGSVGGTLGMCIGFSFSGLVSSLINILQQAIFLMKPKKSNLHKKRSLNNSSEIENRDIENGMGSLEGYSRKGTIHKLRMQERGRGVSQMPILLHKLM